VTFAVLGGAVVTFAFPICNAERGGAGGDGVLADFIVWQLGSAHAIWDAPGMLDPVVKFWEKDPDPADDEIWGEFSQYMGYPSEEKGGDERARAWMSALEVSNPYKFKEGVWRDLEVEYVKLIADQIQLGFFNLMLAIYVVAPITYLLNPASRMLMAIGMVADVCAIRDIDQSPQQLTKCGPGGAAGVGTGFPPGRRTECVGRGGNANQGGGVALGGGKSGIAGVVDVRNKSIQINGLCGYILLQIRWEEQVDAEGDGHDA
jgi:hypothetical protein